MVGMDRNLSNNEVNESGENRHQFQTEEELLHSMGYKQEMNKTMSTISNFSIAFGCCSILSGLTPLWGDAMAAGGSVSVIWGWILVSVFTFGVGLSLAEICSAYPITGGLYIWVSKLAPPNGFPLCVVAITSADIGLAQFISSIVNISDPTNKPTIYWEYGIFIVIAVVHGLINSISVKYNGFFNQTSLYWHLIGTLIIVVVGLVLTPNKPDAKWVFTYFENETGFSSGGYAFLIGLLQCQYTLSGFDSAAHMSDETQDAGRSAPRGILYAIGTAALVGFMFLLSVNFCVQDFQSQIIDTDISPTMVKVFLDGVGYRWTVVFTTIIMGAMFFSGSALTLGSSRMVYAFARDGAMPFSSHLAKINQKTMTPVWAVWFNIVFAIVVGILYIINETAFNAIVSVNTIASSMAYFIPIALKVFVARKIFVRGPFHLGPFSDVINVISLCWILLTSVLFICPTENPVTPDNMNYAIVVFGGVIILSVLYYHFRARKWFHGPGKSLEHDPQLDGLPVETAADDTKQSNFKYDTSSQSSDSDNDAVKKYKVNQVERVN
ncbi:amino acid permease-domain-containing protein [Gilbertella persicaria]|uniref:amino acid permease-domain-containing protein n=1 Tax=Gilbertella persicaria TaxID=101096 RepID=UPI00221ECCF7|nr:amino acid permease-domain-containing protein [Gilbertella persicaria]KAI8081999.1 amino acid permease-domain-containing protein [Gilbertella persicaria]